MYRYLGKLLSVLLICFVVGCKREGLTPGLFPPSFELERLDTGEMVTLEAYKGKTILLNFWATWCPPCIAEMPSLEKLYQANREKDFLVIGIASQDSKKDVQEFILASNITFPILLDPKGIGTQKLELGGFPETFLLDQEGKFKLISDPKGGELVFRVIGERAWESGEFLKLTIKN